MATFVQSASAKGVGVANITVTMTITAGNLVVSIGAGNHATAYVIGDLTDNKSQTYSITDTEKDISNDQIIMGYHANAASGSTIFKMTPPGSSDTDIAVHEYSGCDTSAPLGEHSGHISGSNDSTIDCGTITTTTAHGVVVCAGVNDGNTNVLTAPSGFTKRQEIVTNTNMPMVSGDDIVTATGTFNPIWTGASSTQKNAGVVALFKDAAGGGGSTFPLPEGLPQQQMKSAIYRM